MSEASNFLLVFFIGKGQMMLPGEVFTADVQCQLQFGPESRHSSFQSGQDLCTDLHCIRDHYTWASHSALEGTHCGIGKVLYFSKLTIFKIDYFQVQNLN